MGSAVEFAGVRASSWSAFERRFSALRTFLIKDAGNSISTLSVLQEREAKKETWKPRWFRATPGAPVFDGEHPEDACPLWEFTGDAFQRPKRPATPDGAPSHHRSNPTNEPQQHILEHTKVTQDRMRVFMIY